MALPLYGALPAADQLRAFQPAGRGRRKAVVATNLAEAAVTIPGIVYGEGALWPPLYSSAAGLQWRRAVAEELGVW